MGENVNFGEILTTGAVGKLIHRSDETVRQLADRQSHPLPYINTGMGKKKQRLFRRTSVLRWLEEEESGVYHEPTAAKPAPRHTRPTKAAKVLAAPPKTRAAAGSRA
jgi:hypothetical protein